MKSNSLPCVSAPIRSVSSVSRKVRVWLLGPYASTLILARSDPICSLSLFLPLCSFLPVVLSRSWRPAVPAHPRSARRELADGASPHSRRLPERDNAARKEHSADGGLVTTSPTRLTSPLAATPLTPTRSTTDARNFDPHA